jgi:Flp pilus assembly protein TadG
MRILHRIAGEEHGSAMMEFALSAVVLLMVIFGIMDFSRAVYVYHFVSYSAQQGTRYAIVRGAHWGSTSCASTTTLACNATAANVQSYVQSLATKGITASKVTVTTTWPGTNLKGSSTGCGTANSSGCLVKVKVSYSFSFILPFLPKSALGFTGTSEAVIQE